MKKIIVLLGLIIFSIALASCGSNPRPDESVFQTQAYTGWLTYVDFDSQKLNRPNTSQNHNAISAPTDISGSLISVRTDVSSNISSDRFVSLSVNFLSTTNFAPIQSAIINATRSMELQIPGFATPNALSDLVLSDIQEYITAANNDEAVFLNVIYMPILFEQRTISGGEHTTMLTAFVLVPVFFTLSIGTEVPAEVSGIDQVRFGLTNGNLTNITAV